ncbi:unnamed protein product [Symbiodinium sp. CCMP2592]|nr:unnamed protein product [Symbiodinium sp. CCMP2592]
MTWIPDGVNIAAALLSEGQVMHFKLVDVSPPGPVTTRIRYWSQESDSLEFLERPRALPDTVDVIVAHVQTDKDDTCGEELQKKMKKFCPAFVLLIVGPSLDRAAFVGKWAADWIVQDDNALTNRVEHWLPHVPGHSNVVLLAKDKSLLQKATASAQQSFKDWAATQTRGTSLASHLLAQKEFKKAWKGKPEMKEESEKPNKRKADAGDVDEPPQKKITREDVIAQAKSLNLMCDDYAATEEHLKAVTQAKVTQRLSVKGEVLALLLLAQASESGCTQPLVISTSKWPKPKASFASLPRSLHDVILVVPSSRQGGEMLVRSLLPAEILKMKGWNWRRTSLATLSPKTETKTAERMPYMPVVRSWLQGVLSHVTK